MLDPELIQVIKTLPFGAKSLSGKCRSTILCFLYEHHLLNNMKIKNGRLIIPKNNISGLPKRTVKCLKKV